MRTRIPVIATGLAMTVVFALAASTASASTIAFVRGGAAWVSAPDGSDAHEAHMSLPHWHGVILGPGARIKALITKPLSIGVESVWKIGRHGVKHSNLCVPPGRHPQPCPGS